MIFEKRKEESLKNVYDNVRKKSSADFTSIASMSTLASTQASKTTLSSPRTIQTDVSMISKLSDGFRKNLKLTPNLAGENE